MDAACLRIKFAPLLKHFHNDDKNCYLEIVPQISVAKRLEKIKWKDESHIEYKIPMVYKIILRKHLTTKTDCPDDEARGNKDMYHSCVDLLHASQSHLDNTKEITRYVSDNHILGIRVDNIQKFDKLLSHDNKKSKNKLLRSNSCRSPRKCPSTDRHQVEHRENIQPREKYIESCKIYVTNRPDNFLTTQSMSKEKNICQLHTKEADAVKSACHLISRQKSSNYSRNIQPFPTYHDNDKTSTTYHISPGPISDACNASEKILTRPNPFFGSCNIFCLPYYDYFSPVSQEILAKRQNSKIKKGGNEERVTQIVEIMKREMHSINILLDDLINKCLALGVNLSVVTNNMKNLSKSTVISVPKQCKPNRAVFNMYHS